MNEQKQNVMIKSTINDQQIFVDGETLSCSSGRETHVEHLCGQGKDQTQYLSACSPRLCQLSYPTCYD
jgi:hypothetical protein